MSGSRNFSSSHGVSFGGIENFGCGGNSVIVMNLSATKVAVDSMHLTLEMLEIIL